HTGNAMDVDARATATTRTASGARVHQPSENFRFCDSYHSAANLRTFGSSAPIHPASKQPWSPPIRPGLFHWARLAAVLSPCAPPHQIEAPLTLKWGRSE